VSEDAAGAPQRPLALVAKPWFWIVVIGGLWMLPLVKSLGAKLPDPLPGEDAAPVTFAAVDEDGDRVALADLAGYLVLACHVSAADETESSRMLGLFQEVRSRLRGLGSSVVYLVLLSDGEPADLTAILDHGSRRRPSHVALLDADGSAAAALARAAADLGSAETPGFFLLDTHGRLRGAYTAEERALDRLVTEAGQLANWRAQDPDPAR